MTLHEAKNLSLSEPFDAYLELVKITFLDCLHKNRLLEEELFPLLLLLKVDKGLILLVSHLVWILLRFLDALTAKFVLHVSILLGCIEWWWSLIVLDGTLSIKNVVFEFSNLINELFLVQTLIASVWWLSQVFLMGMKRFFYLLSAVCCTCWYISRLKRLHIFLKFWVFNQRLCVPLCFRAVLISLSDIKAISQLIKSRIDLYRLVVHLISTDCSIAVVVHPKLMFFWFNLL